MSQYGLTQRQRDLYRFVASYIAASGGVSPSLDECSTAMRLARSGVHRLICGLEERGLITRSRTAQRSCARGIEVMHPILRITAPDGAPLVFIPTPAGRPSCGSGPAACNPVGPTHS